MIAATACQNVCSNNSTEMTPTKIVANSRFGDIQVQNRFSGRPCRSFSGMKPAPPGSTATTRAPYVPSRTSADTSAGVSTDAISPCLTVVPSLDHSSTQPVNIDQIPRMFRSCYWPAALPQGSRADEWWVVGVSEPLIHPPPTTRPLCFLRGSGGARAAGWASLRSAALAVGQAQGDAGSRIPQDPAVLAAEPEAVQRPPPERDADRTQDGGDRDRYAQPRQPPREEPPAECGDGERADHHGHQAHL